MKPALKPAAGRADPWTTDRLYKDLVSQTMTALKSRLDVEVVPERTLAGVLEAEQQGGQWWAGGVWALR